MPGKTQLVAGIGNYGDLIRYVLDGYQRERGKRKVSYEQLAQMMRTRGMKHPRTGSEISKSLVTNYAVDRAKSPQWFLDAVGQVLGLPERWHETIHPKESNFYTSIGKQEVVETNGITMSMRYVDLAPPASVGGLRNTYLPNQDHPSMGRILVPAIFAQSNAIVVGVLIDRPIAMPHWSVGKTIVYVNTKAANATLDKIYITTEDSGELNARKAVWDSKHSRLVLRSCSSNQERFPDAAAPSSEGDSDLRQCWIDGLVIGVQPRLVPEGTLPPMTYDLEGVEIDNWSE
jgi:hypothetical protein